MPLLSRRRGAPAGGAATAAATSEVEDDRSKEAIVQAAGDDEVIHHSTGSGQLKLYDKEEARRWEEEQERAKAELSIYKAVLGQVYSCRKPRDFIAGTSSGLKTVARGVGLGVASLVAQPYLGAKHGGVRGFAKGVGAGLATCAASTVAGTVVGTGQIVRGVVNTPGAMANKARGKVWNSEKRSWEEDWYSLPEEEIEVFGPGGISSAGNGSGDGLNADEATPSASSTSGAAPRRPARRVADTTLYDLLEVTPEASEAQIRRAFYKKSLVLHPDKNPDNPEATKQFQAVSDAYRVLADEERRKVYDEHGQDSAAAGMPKIEPAVFFAALFGSHHFETFVGRLRLAQDIDGDLQVLVMEAALAGGDDVNEPPPLDPLKLKRAYDQAQVVQRRREVRCAVELATRLAPVVGPGASEAEKAEAFKKWREEQAAEVAKLAKVPCGVEMLYLVGWIYANRSRQFCAGWMVRRLAAQVEAKVHFAQSKAKLYGSVGKTCLQVNGAMKSMEKKKSLKEKEAGSEKEKGTSSAKAENSEAKSAADSGLGGGSASSTNESSQPAEQSPPDVNSSPTSHTSTEAPKRGVFTCDDSFVGGFASSSAPPRGSPGVFSTPSPSVDAKATGAQLLPGAVVILHGLKGAPELNDEVGVICGFDDLAGRYLVQILPDGGLKSLRRENLTAVQAEGDNSSGQGASASSTGSAEGRQYSAEDGQYAPGGDEAEFADAFKDCIPLFHDAFWSATVLDVESTLGKVVQKVLRDMSVDKATRKQRAEALLQLGRLMQEPMAEKKRQAKVTPDASSATSSATTNGAKEREFSTSCCGASPSASKRSILAKFKHRTPWSRSSAQKSEAKAKSMDVKRKRLEGALAMMAAGASTEDVDEMVAARTAMEAEMEAADAQT